jgi:thioredoxin 1
MSIREVTDADFNEAIQAGGEGLTLVDFGAPWCPPCRTLLPILGELDEELDGRASILKVNADDSPATATAYGIMSMPTVILFKDGQPVEKLVGLRSKEAYLTLINRYSS